MLVRLLYASRATAQLDAAILDSIMDQSRRNNPRNGITGLLCHSEDIFLQVIEGGRDAICDLYNRIVTDRRHTQIRLLTYDEISVRNFGGWTMGQVNTARVNPLLLLKHSEKAALDPFCGPGTASMALLSELIATAAVVNRSE
jgi:hypothetical protein